MPVINAQDVFGSRPWPSELAPGGSPLLGFIATEFLKRAKRGETVMGGQTPTEVVATMIAAPAGAPTLASYVEANRQIVDCPFTFANGDACGSASYVDPDWLYFFCLDCESADATYQWVPVTI